MDLKELPACQHAFEGMIALDAQGNCVDCNRSAWKILGLAGPTQLLGTNVHYWLNRPPAPLPCRDPGCPVCALVAADTWQRPEAEGRCSFGAPPAPPVACRLRLAAGPAGPAAPAVRHWLFLLPAEAVEPQGPGAAALLARLGQELRIPMNGVISMAAMLADTRLDNEQRKFTQLIKSSSEALQSLINDILDYARIEAGRLSIENADFHLRQVVEDTVALFGARARDKGLALGFELPERIWTSLTGDPGRLRQILIYLIDNAIKYTAQGKVGLGIEAIEETEAQALLRFTVSDTGPGVPADRRELLFEPFSAARATGESPAAGTGLGLAISRQLARLMGGDAGFESQDGQGSLFWFTARFKKRQAGQLSNPPPANLAGSKVLLLSADQSESLLRRSQLTAWGCQLQECASGQACLDLVQASEHRQDPFNAILICGEPSDMGLSPLVDQLRSLSFLDDCALIILSEPGCVDGSDGCALHEKVEILFKPVAEQELQARLSRGAGNLVEVAPDAPAPASATPAFIDSRPLERHHILVVEDNPANQLLMVRQLENLGYAALGVGNGLEALSELRRTPFSLIFLDCELPVMSGYEVTARIRDARTPVHNHRVPIVALSAADSPVERERCLAAGMDDQVAKPVGLSELAVLLKRWLGSAVSDKAAPSARVGDQSMVRPFSAAEPPHLLHILHLSAVMSRINDTHLLHEMCKIALVDFPERVNRIRAFVDSGDIQRVINEAHAIKGAAATISAELLSETARQLEKSAMAGEITALPAIALELSVVLDQTIEAIQACLDKP